MNLVLFDHMKDRYGHRAQYRSVSVNRKNGRFDFSVQAIEDLNLFTSKSIVFARDSDSKGDWYFHISQTDEGCPVRASRQNKKKYLRTGVMCRSLSSEILDAVKAKIGATFLISKRPKVIDGKEWYQILTSKPIRIN